jgi:hypothetical protein
MVQGKGSIAAALRVALLLAAVWVAMCVAPQCCKLHDLLPLEGCCCNFLNAII